eukprot:471567-Prorocentrum_minimum.AAC.3
MLASSQGQALGPTLSSVADGWNLSGLRPSRGDGEGVCRLDAQELARQRRGDKLIKSLLRVY